MAKVIKKCEEEVTLQAIQKIVDEGKAEELLPVGTQIEIVLKDFSELILEVASLSHYHDGDVVLVAKNCLPNRMSMNAENTNDGAWKECDLRKYLNGDFLELLPDGFRKMLRKKKTRQVLPDGTVLKCKDLVWIPTEREMFGEDIFGSGDDREKQLELFKDRRNRIKNIAGKPEDICWYWLASPSATHSAHFCNVNTGGSADDNNASYSSGVAPGFVIRKSKNLRP